MYIKTEAEIDLINFLQSECPEIDFAAYRVFITVETESNTVENICKRGTHPNPEYIIRLEADNILLYSTGDNFVYATFFNGYYVSECPVGNATVPQETITHKDAFESLKDYIKEICNE